MRNSSTLSYSGGGGGSMDCLCYQAGMRGEGERA